MSERQAIITATNIRQTFNTPEGPTEVIAQANLAIGENTFNIIYGPSGSGKSTILNILSGLQKPTLGQVTIQGRDLYGLNQDELAFFRANRIGIVYQTNYWVSSLSVLENVALPLNFLGYKSKQAETMAKQSLERVGMIGYSNKSPLLLSGGEQQRVAMARAIANTPLFIVADEPTGNLDIERGNQIIEMLQNYRDEFRGTIILVTHNIEYLPVGDTIYYVKDGLVEESNAAKLEKATQELLDGLKTRLGKAKEPRLVR